MCTKLYKALADNGYIILMESVTKDTQTCEALQENGSQQMYLRNRCIYERALLNAGFDIVKQSFHLNDCEYTNNCLTTPVIVYTLRKKNV